MATRRLSKEKRHKLLSEKITKEPFLTDEELAKVLNVSVPTIRLDRMELAIPELRERIEKVANSKATEIKSLSTHEIIGDIVDFNLGKNAISILEPTPDMAFEKTNIIRGHYIYSLAESLAIATIDADVALVGVANIKYKVPVYSGDRLVAKSELKNIRDNKYIVWVKIYIKEKEVFRGKFILVAVNENKGDKS